MSHPDEGVLNAWLDGELDGAAAARVETHVATCAPCRALLDEARSFRDESFALIEVLDEAPAVPAVGAAPAAAMEPAGSRPAASARAATGEDAGPRARPPRRWMAGLAWAATVVVAVTAGYALGLGRTRSEPPLSARDLALEARRAPEPTVAPPTDVAAAADAPPREPARAGSARAADETQPAPADREPTAEAAPPKVEGRVLAKERSREESAPATGASALRAERLAESTDARQAEKAIETPRASLNAAQDRARRFAPAAPVEDRTLLAAIQLLGGSIRLVDGLVPRRVELADTLVRVHYGTGAGEVVLEQWREGDTIRTRLVTPPGTPADSIAAWSRRIR